MGWPDGYKQAFEKSRNWLFSPVATAIVGAKVPVRRGFNRFKQTLFL